MSAEQLITQHIDTWTSALQMRSTAGRGNNGKIDLYGIKKLRELILELAVRGKLVPQDPNEEPASTLLKCNEQRKQELTKSGNMKTAANVNINVEDCYLDLPKNWSWIRLGNLAKFIDYRGKTPKKTEYGIRLITAKNIKKGYIDLNPEEFITEKDYQLWMTRGFPKNGDLLFTTEAPLGNAAIIELNEKFALAQRSICFQWHIPEISPFMLIQLLARPFQSQLKDKSTGMTATGIKAAKLKEIPVILPPVYEQHKIVLRVKELMSLCDQLEQQSLTSLEAHSQLVETLLATLTNSQNAEELAENWARISQHFDTLFTTEASIDALKQTILQLAVMGKLVPQDPSDEPASELLKRIEQEKAQLMKEGKIKKQKPLPPVSDEEKPFGLPEGWEFIRLGDLTSKMGSGSTPRGGQSAYVTEGIPFLRSQNVWNEGLRLDDVVYIDKNTHSKMDGTKVFPGDILLNITGASLGRTLIFPDHIIEANVSQHVTIIRLLLGELAPFVHLAIKSPLIQNLVWRRQVGMAIEGLSKKTLELFEFPVPPLLEQHRIVTKIDELFIICEQLKSRLRSAQQTQLHLANALTDAALS